MKKDAKVKQIVVRFDTSSYESISKYAKKEHRGLGEFIRHVTLNYIEQLNGNETNPTEKEEDIT